MKQRPILFSGPMVTAILEGRKTQTRRIVKPVKTTGYIHWNQVVLGGNAGFCDEHGRPISCPYGIEGDQLWVRETWAEVCHAEDGQCYGEECTECAFEYRADKPNAKWAGDWPNEFKGDEVPLGCKWKPSLFMPRHACRINLEIQSIRVERLQDISEADAISEGVTNAESFKGIGLDDSKANRYAFKELWCSIHSHESWDSNPFVWVVEFKQIPPETPPASPPHTAQEPAG